MTQAQNIGQQESAPVENAMNIGEQFFAEFESASAAEPISKPDQSAPAAHVEEQNLERGAIPEWLNDGVEPSLQKDFANSDSSQTDLTDWLSNLDEESGLPFDKMPTPASIAADAASNKPSAPKTDLPDWLSGVDSQTKEAADEWLPIAKETPAPVGDDLSPWEHREKFESAQSLPTPTSPSDWKPVEPQSAPVKPAESAPAQQPVATEPPAKKKSGLPATRSPKLEAPSGTVALDQAKSELDRGEIPTALKHYGSLIKKGKHLEETIRDLKESIYRYPVEVGIWQTLGDAYMRANRLKEALEAYNKAEELIR